MQLDINLISTYLDQTLQEDYGIRGDITSDALIDQREQVEFSINSRDNIVICGTPITEYFFTRHSKLDYIIHFKDGQRVEAGNKIIEGAGKAKDILRLERIILNYMQHLSGIATLTSAYVAKIKDTKAKIYDTRKTIPGLRSLQKYAVRCGGGYNHRLTLDSCIMIKDNHIAICGSITQAVKKAKDYSPHYARIEVECDTIDQVKEALAAGADIIMLDNMNIDQTKQAVQIIAGRAIIEASGGVDLASVRQIADCGVDVISVGRLTHSAPAADIGLDIIK